jgi:hypothetical protein
MPDQKAPRGAVFQFEIDRKRFLDRDSFQCERTVGETPVGRIEAIAKTAVVDTLRHGGTFIIVVTDDKITMVQRPDAEEIG